MLKILGKDVLDAVACDEVPLDILGFPEDAFYSEFYFKVDSLPGGKLYQIFFVFNGINDLLAKDSPTVEIGSHDEVNIGRVRVRRMPHLQFFRNRNRFLKGE